MKESIYNSLPPEFYDSSLNSSNPITKHYHKERYQKIRHLLSKRYKPGMNILDVGGGSSSWNIERMPVVSLDNNRTMLEYGKSKGYIKEKMVWNLERMPLPFENESFNFVVISEVFEHIEYPEKVAEEIFRILKTGGHIIATVPLDTNLSLWSILFGLNCILLGDLLGNEYYKKRCGHIHHFSVESLADLLGKNRFKIIEKDITTLNICILGQK